MKKSEIYLGDCLDLIPKHIEDKSIDMIFCDLPYGTTQCKWDSVINLSKLWIQYERVIKDNGAIVLFGQSPFDKLLGVSNIKLLKYEWIWEKTQATGHLNAKKMPMKAHENILVFYKKLPTYNYQKTTGHVRKVSSAASRKKSLSRRDYSEGYIYGKENLSDTANYDSTERYPRSVLTFASDKQKNKLHPTQKPIALIEYMVKTYTNEGDMILDNCCGSGTTGRGAKNLNRHYIMMEKEEKYYNITCDRLNM
jgi:DNA modification methylase